MGLVTPNTKQKGELGILKNMEIDKVVRDECWGERRRMSVSTSMFGCRVVAPPSLGSMSRSNGGLTIVCSSRPKKKGTSHHMKTRPRKSQPWDINRKPTVYDPLPPLPPDWSVVIPADDSFAAVAVAVTSQPSTPST